MLHQKQLPRALKVEASLHQNPYPVPQSLRVLPEALNLAALLHLRVMEEAQAAAQKVEPITTTPLEVKLLFRYLYPLEEAATQGQDTLLLALTP